jgi:hypothetical protein
MQENFAQNPDETWRDICFDGRGDGDAGVEKEGVQNLCCHQEQITLRL